jgi:hypothetical protein
MALFAIMPSTEFNPLPDVSETFDIVADIAASVEQLHRSLDGFVHGRAAKLSSDRVRTYIGSSLSTLDDHLHRVQELRAAGQQQTRGQITATHVTRLRSINKHFAALNSVLYPLYVDRRAHNISEEQNELMTHHIIALRDNLSRLLEEAGLDRQDENKSA